MPFSHTLSLPSPALTVFHSPAVRIESRPPPAVIVIGSRAAPRKRSLLSPKRTSAAVAAQVTGVPGTQPAPTVIGCAKSSNWNPVAKSKCATRSLGPGAAW